MTAMADAALAEMDSAKAWIKHWRGTTGPAHDDARVEAQAAIARWRTYHDAPAQAAYRAALARGQHPTREAA